MYAPAQHSQWVYFMFEPFSKRIPKTEQNAPTHIVCIVGKHTIKYVSPFFYFCGFAKNCYPTNNRWFSLCNLATPPDTDEGMWIAYFMYYNMMYTMYVWYYGHTYRCKNGRFCTLDLWMCCFYSIWILSRSWRYRWWYNIDGRTQRFRIKFCLFTWKFSLIFSLFLQLDIKCSNF